MSERSAVGRHNNRARLPFALLLAVPAAVLVVAACGGSAPKYDITMTFSASVTRADLDDVNDLLLSYDDGVDFVVRESFPPVGVATVQTDVLDFCRTIEAELEGRTSIDDVTCEKAKDAPLSDGDTPVSNP